MDVDKGVVKSIFDEVFSEWMESCQLIMVGANSYHFVKSGFQEIRVGRGKDCDIEVIEPTVSRNNSRIY